MMGLVSWWKRDTARHTFVYTNFIVALPFSIFSTYVTYQLQFIGFAIGTDLEGGPCTTYCIVPFGSQRLDLNTVLLYMNALIYALGGVVGIFIIAYADFWKNKSLIVTITTVIYGILAIPTYWLTKPTLSNFNCLLALSILFQIGTIVLIAVLSIYVPHCMRLANSADTDTNTSSSSSVGEKPDTAIAEGKSRKYGFAMSVLGMVAGALASILMIAIVTIMTATLSGESQQTAGLLITTIIGFITVFAAAGCYFGLPVLPARAWPADSPLKTALIEVFVPFKYLLIRKNMLFLLLAYTIYTDAAFAVSSIVGQLYYAELKPGPLEFSLYSLAFNFFNLFGILAFFFTQRLLKLNLEKCLVVGYALMVIVPLWGCIGIADQNAFGDKHRWEFYVQTLLGQISAGIVNPTFRLLYAEMIPEGEEIMWFGLQIVLSCATTWINFVATGPLQNKTHNLRFPMIICLVFFLVPLVLEALRISLPVFKRDRAKWQGPERTGAEQGALPGDASQDTEEITVGEKGLA